MITNALLFQLGWSVCVIAGSGSWHILGTLLVILLLAVHLKQALRPKPESTLVVCVLAMGLVWDSALVNMEVLKYNYGILHSKLAPHWIMAMWALFATTLNLSLNWLKGRWTLTVLFGAAGGPLAYWLGSRLGAVEIVNPNQGLVFLALGWSLLMPAMVGLSRKFNGMQLVLTDPEKKAKE